MAAAAVLTAITAALVARIAWREALPPHSTNTAGAAGAQYLLNPITLAACATLPPATLARNAAIAACFAAASDACGLGSALLLVYAVGALLPVQAGVAAAPLAMLAAARSRAHWRARGLTSWVARELAGLSASSAFLAVGVWAQLLPWPPAPALGLAGLSPTSLWPELSLWWYLLALAFGRHLPYFVPIVWAHPLAYIVPVTLRLRCVGGVVSRWLEGTWATAGGRVCVSGGGWWTPTEACACISSCRCEPPITDSLPPATSSRADTAHPPRPWRSSAWALCLTPATAGASPACRCASAWRWHTLTW